MVDVDAGTLFDGCALLIRVRSEAFAFDMSFVASASRLGSLGAASRGLAVVLVAALRVGLRLDRLHSVDLPWLSTRDDLSLSRRT